YKVFAYAENGISCSNKSASIYRLSKPKISSLTNSAAKKMTVKYNKNSKANGYKIQYATSSSFTSAKTVTVTPATTVTKVIASLTKGKTYYVRVRSYKKVSGVTYQSTWSDKKAVKIKK
ncbi:MAG: fibronectin type III domain-containing protein, partial [Dorea sp.]|nr:fibronectin type III domain-containing protein [Dorea sp.]